MLLAIVLVAAGYQVLAIFACLRRGHGPGASGQSPASVLKPLHGLDAGFREALRSHSVLDGEFELLCGVRSLDDPAVAVARQFPEVRVIECRTKTPNGKVAVLADLAREARYPILVVNDSDIRVEPDY